MSNSSLALQLAHAVVLDAYLKTLPIKGERGGELERLLAGAVDLVRLSDRVLKGVAS